jgi:predicted small secreted protein
LSRDLARGVNMKKTLIAWTIIVLTVSMLLSGCTQTENTTTAETTSTETTTEISSSSISLPCVFEGIMIAGSPSTPVEITLDTGVPSIPDTLPVYKVIAPEVNSQYAWSIAQTLGFAETDAIFSPGEIRQVYTYQNEIGTLEIEDDGYVNFYSDYDSSKPENLPTDEECIDIATEWLQSCNMYPENITSTNVSNFIEVEEYDTSSHASIKYTVAKSVVFYVGLNDYGNSFSVSVVIADNGKIIKAQADFVNYEEYTTVEIITPDEAIDILERYLEGTLEKTASLKCLTNYSDFNRLTITKISIQYSTGAGNYAQPIYLIEGTAAYEGWDGTDEFRGRVDAVVRD